MNGIVRANSGAHFHYVLVKLSDCSVTTDVFDTKDDAIRHSHAPSFPLMLLPTGITARALRNLVSFQRGLYDAGQRLQADFTYHVSAPGMRSGAAPVSRSGLILP